MINQYLESSLLAEMTTQQHSYLPVDAASFNEWKGTLIESSRSSPSSFPSLEADGFCEEPSGMRSYAIGPSEDAETILPFDRFSLHSRASILVVPWLSPRTWWCFGKWWLSDHSVSEDDEYAQVAEMVFRRGQQAEARTGTGVFGTVKTFFRG